MINAYSSNDSNPFDFVYKYILPELEIDEYEIEIEQVYFRDNTTIISWSDGTKTIVNCTEETFDAEKGLAMCIVKKFLGNYTKFDNALKNAVYDKTVSRKQRKTNQNK